MALGDAQFFPDGLLSPAAAHDRDGGGVSYAKIERDRRTASIRASKPVTRPAAVDAAFQLSEVLSHAPSCFTSHRINAASRCITALDDLPLRYASARTVYLSHNNLTSLRGIEQFTGVESLGLAGNLIPSIPELQRLAPCKSLAHLSLAGNPLCSAPYYRLRTLALLAHVGIRLMTLDGIPVRSDELESIPATLAHHAAVLTVCTTQEARALHLAHMLKLLTVHTQLVTDARARSIVSGLRVEAPADLHPLSLSLLLTTLERSSPLVTHPRPILQLSLERRASRIYTKMRGATPALTLPASSTVTDAAIVPETRVWQRAFAQLCALQTRVCAELLVMVERASQRLFHVRKSHAARDPLRLRSTAAADQPSVTSAWMQDRSRITHDLLHTIDAQRATNSMLQPPVLPNRHRDASHTRTQPATVPATVTSASSRVPEGDAVPAESTRSVRFSPELAARRASERVRETRAHKRQHERAAADTLVRKYTHADAEGKISASSSTVGSRGSSRAASRSASRASSVRGTPASSAPGSRRPSVDETAPLESGEALDALLGWRVIPSVNVDASYAAPSRIQEAAASAPAPRSMHHWQLQGDGAWTHAARTTTVDNGDDTSGAHLNITRAGEDAFRAAAAAIDAAEATRLGVPVRGPTDIVSVPALEASRVVSAVRESERVLRDALDRHGQARSQASASAASAVATTAAASALASSGAPTSSAPSSAEATASLASTASTTAGTSATTIDAAISRLLSRMRTSVDASPAASSDADYASVLHAAADRLGMYRDTNTRNVQQAQARVQALASQLQTSRAASDALQSRVGLESPARAAAMPVSHAVRGMLPHASAADRLASREFDPAFYLQPHTRKDMLHQLHDVVAHACRTRALRVHLRAWEFSTAAHAFREGSHERGALPRMRIAWKAWRTAQTRAHSFTAARMHMARTHHARYTQRVALRAMVLYLLHRRRINRLYDSSHDIADECTRIMKATALRALRNVQRDNRREAAALTRALAFRASRLLRTCVHAWFAFRQRVAAVRGLEQQVQTAQLWLRTRMIRSAVRTWHDYTSERVHLQRRADTHAAGMQADLQRGLLRTWRALASSRDRARTMQRLTATPARKLSRAARAPPAPPLPPARDANMRALAARVGSRGFMRVHAAASPSPVRCKSRSQSSRRTTVSPAPVERGRSASRDRTSRAPVVPGVSSWLRAPPPHSSAHSRMDAASRALSNVRQGGRSDFSVRVTAGAQVGGRPPQARRLLPAAQPPVLTNMEARMRGRQPPRGAQPSADPTPAGRPGALFAFVPAMR